MWGNLQAKGYLNKPPPPWFSAYTGGIDLSDAQLQKAHLYKAQLQHASLQAAELQDAFLWRAQLHNASLRFAQLQKAHLYKAQLHNADLEEAQLQNADLTRAQLQGAYLFGAEIEKAHLEDVDWGGGYTLGEEKAKRFQDGEAVYRRLKQWYSHRGQSDHAGEFHFREMECRRKGVQGSLGSGVWGPLKRGKVREGLKGLKEARELPWLWAFRLSCGYGERPSWTLGWLLIAFVFPTLAYLFVAGLALKQALFYSAAFLVPFGEDAGVEVLPWAWADLALLQAYAGYFLMALFLVVLVLKMGHR